MNRIALAVAAVTVVFVSGCYNVIDGGPEASETRTVEGFDALRVNDGLHVKWVKGASQVTIDSQEKVLKYVETTVKAGRLTVGLRSGVKVTTPENVEITVFSETLDTIETTGGSQLIADDLSANPLRLSASGGSQISASGASADVRIEASGGSKIVADKLVAQDVEVDASGGATVEVQALKSVVGSASGGATVTVTGGGDVSKLDLSGGASVN